MRFDVITLFPELFEPFFTSGINRRAFEAKQVDVRLWNPRDFAEGNYRRVDDRPFGGGPGMVMMVPVRATMKPAPAATLRLLMLTVKSFGAPIFFASSEKEYWVLAIQIG